MVAHFIYFFGRESLKEAPFLIEFDFSKLIKSENYDEIEKKNMCLVARKMAKKIL